MEGGWEQGQEMGVSTTDTSGTTTTGLPRLFVVVVKPWF